MLPSVVEYLYDELDGVSDLMSPVQPLLTQAVTDCDHSKLEQQKLNWSLTPSSIIPKQGTAKIKLELTIPKLLTKNTQ